VLDNLFCISDIARFSLYVKIWSPSIGLFLFRTSSFPSRSYITLRNYVETPDTYSSSIPQSYTCGW